MRSHALGITIPVVGESPLESPDMKRTICENTDEHLFIAMLCWEFSWMVA